MLLHSVFEIQLFAVFDKKPTDGQALIPQLSELLHDWIFLAGGKTKAAKFSLENAMQANKQCCNRQNKQRYIMYIVFMSIVYIDPHMFVCMFESK